jgi:sigma-70-like protein
MDLEQMVEQASLTPGARRLFLLRYVVGYSAREVAAMFRQSPANIRKRSARALSRIRAATEGSAEGRKHDLPHARQVPVAQEVETGGGKGVGRGGLGEVEPDPDTLGMELGLKEPGGFQ